MGYAARLGEGPPWLGRIAKWIVLAPLIFVAVCLGSIIVLIGLAVLEHENAAFRHFVNGCPAPFLGELAASEVLEPIDPNAKQLRRWAGIKRAPAITPKQVEAIRKLRRSAS